MKVGESSGIVFMISILICSLPAQAAGVFQSQAIIEEKLAELGGGAEEEAAEEEEEEE